MATGAHLSFSSGLGVRTRCVRPSLRALRACFEFSFGERRRGLRNVDFDTQIPFLNTQLLTIQNEQTAQEV
jgi:hypothetical protein